MPSASAAAAAALKVHSSPSNQTNPDQIISNASSDQAASALDHNQNSQNSFPSAALLTTRQQEPTNQPSAAQQKCNSTGQSGHTKSHSEESTTGHTLSPTQLSASLWAIASLGLRPPAPWLAAYMKATHSSLQVGVLLQFYVLCASCLFLCKLLQVWACIPLLRGWQPT